MTAARHAAMWNVKAVAALLVATVLLGAPAAAVEIIRPAPVDQGVAGPGLPDGSAGSLPGPCRRGGAGGTFVKDDASPADARRTTRCGLSPVSPSNEPLACPLQSGPLTMFGLDLEGVDHGQEAAWA